MYPLLTICFIAAVTAMPAIPYNLEWTPYGLQYIKPGMSLAGREKIYVNDGKQVIILPSIPQSVQQNPVGPAFLQAIAAARQMAMEQIAASKPAQTEQPAQPDQSTQSDNPQESAQSEQPDQSEEITKFEEPSEQPIRAVPSLGPLDPAIIEAIAEAREAARERALAVESEESAQSAGLAKLDDPAQPEETAGPEQQAQPVQPAQTEKPDQPGKPAKPEGSKKPMIIMLDDAAHQGFNNWFPFINSRPSLGNYQPHFPNLSNYHLQNFPNLPNYQFPNLPSFYNYQVPNIPISSNIPPLRALKSPYMIYRNRY